MGCGGRSPLAAATCLIIHNHCRQKSSATQPAIEGMNDLLTTLSKQVVEFTVNALTKLDQVAPDAFASQCMLRLVFETRCTCADDNWLTKPTDLRFLLPAGGTLLHFLTCCPVLQPNCARA